MHEAGLLRLALITKLESSASAALLRSTSDMSRAWGASKEQDYPRPQLFSRFHFLTHLDSSVSGNSIKWSLS